MVTAFGWVLLAVGGWILLSALAVTVWVWLGRWHNRRQFLRHAAALSADFDDLDDVCRTAGVLRDDSRHMARWCDQSSIDRIFAGMVDTPAMQAIDIDKEN